MLLKRCWGLQGRRRGEKVKTGFKRCCGRRVSLWQIIAHFKLPLFKTLVAALLRGLFPHEFQSQHQETGNPEQLETILMPVRSRIISRRCWFRASVSLCPIKRRPTEEKVAKFLEAPKHNIWLTLIESRSVSCFTCQKTSNNHHFLLQTYLILRECVCLAVMAPLQKCWCNTSAIIIAPKCQFCVPACILSTLAPPQVVFLENHQARHWSWKKDICRRILEPNTHLNTFSGWWCKGVNSKSFSCSIGNIISQMSFLLIYCIEQSFNLCMIRIIWAILHIWKNSRLKFFFSSFTFFLCYWP